MLRPRVSKLGGGPAHGGGLPLFTHSSSQRSCGHNRVITGATFALLLLAFLYASLWWSAFVFPATVSHASQWKSRTQGATLALQTAPVVATSVGLVVARFSGNLSWVPAIQQLMHVTETTVYCKVSCFSSHVPCAPS